MRDKPEIKPRFDAMSQKTMQQAIYYSDEDYASGYADEAAPAMMKEMSKSEEDAKIVVQRHALKCKVLLKEIEDREAKPKSESSSEP